MNNTPPIKFGMGASILRKEDNAFITGKGRFTDDITQENMLFGYVLRSPYAHAHFKITDITAASEMNGVHRIFTYEDIKHLNPLPCTAPVKQPDGSMSVGRNIPVLCEDIVRHVGDAVAFIVADSLAIAKDASEMIEIDFDALPVIADTAKALDEDAAKVYSDGDQNLAFTSEIGEKEKSAEIFENAAHVSTIALINNRLVSNYLEPRACLASWDEEKRRYDVTAPTQGVHRTRTPLAKVMGIEPEEIHMITPDVGGGFGTKVFNYREYALCLVAAKILGRPVKWTCDRTEHFISDAHGRDNVVSAKMAMDSQGKFLAMEVDLIAAMGAYLHALGPFIPSLGLSMATGVYDIKTLFCRMRGAYTNTVPLDAYRGAGRPEASYLIERLVDKCADDMGMMPDEIRALNFIKPEQMPYTTPNGRMYDTGDFNAHMELCKRQANWDDFATRREEAANLGKLRGIGMSTYIEACAFAGSEPAFISLKQDGDFELRIGTQSNGQGHATAYSQLAAEALGIDFTKIDVRQGDSDELKHGGGTGGSRSIPLGGVSAVYASETLAQQMKAIAADELEAAPSDIELIEGEAKIIGTDRAISFADIAAAAPSPESLMAKGEFKQAEATYPNGTHICEIEIDPQTGASQIIKYTIVDDFGVSVNPILLEGQVHGGVVQSIGQCLTERTYYDEEGQLLTASFMDYAMPRASDVPWFDFETLNVPSTTNALGIKGAGEAGTIGACPAIMNAITNALQNKHMDGHVGKHIDMPATPSILWSVLNA